MVNLVNFDLAFDREFGGAWEDVSDTELKGSKQLDAPAAR